MYVVKVDTSGVAPCNWVPYTLSPLAVNPIGQSQHQPYSGSLPVPLVLVGNPTPSTLSTDALCTSGATGGLEHNPQGVHLQVLPTLVQAGFRVETDQTGWIALEVFTAEGRQIHFQRIGSGDMVSTESWPSGVYILKLQFDSGTVLLRKVVRG